MKEDTTWFLFGVLVGVLLMGSVTAIFANKARIEEENKAIKAKVAEYYLDENNEKQFRYKEIK